LDFIRFFDDVIVGENKSRGVNDKAGAQTLARLWGGIAKIADKKFSKLILPKRLTFPEWTAEATKRPFTLLRGFLDDANIDDRWRELCGQVHKD
jgi:hypothetical protein